MPYLFLVLLVASALLSGCFVDPSEVPFQDHNATTTAPPSSTPTTTMTAADMGTTTPPPPPQGPVCTNGRPDGCSCNSQDDCICRNDCTIDCQGLSCDLRCEAGRGVCEFVGLGPRSDVECDGENISCPTTCLEDCEVDCGDEALCRVHCMGTATCRLRCSGDAECSFTTCADEKRCGRDLVCNGDCS